MEGQKALAWEVVTLMLLTSLLVASARQPFAALTLLAGKRAAPKSDQLVCCDSCSCPGKGRRCVCDDTMDGDCADGCLTCACADVGRSCRCLDKLSTCPDTCDSDYIIDHSPARNDPPGPGGAGDNNHRKPSG